MRHLLAVSVCIAILLVILTLGLWPFHAPRNAVSWLQDRNGLRFGDYGTVMSSGAFHQTASPNDAACSIEIWMESARAFWGGTILAFYDPPDPLRLSLHQGRSRPLPSRHTLCGSSAAGRIRAPAPSRIQRQRTLR